MVHIGSEAEKRCGLTLVTLHPGLSPCCVRSLAVSLSASFPFAPFVHIFSSCILSASICLLFQNFVTYLSSSSVIFSSTICSYHYNRGRKADFRWELDELAEEDNEVVGLSKLETVPVLGRPLIVNFNIQTPDLLWWVVNHCRPVSIWPHLNLTDHGHRSQTQQRAPGILGWCGLGCSVSSKASGPPRTNMARSKIKPPRVLQRPCGKAIKWSYRGQKGDEIFNGLHREKYG